MLDLEQVVTVGQQQKKIRELIPVCQPGDIITGLDVNLFSTLLHFLRKNNPTLNYFTDRRYGEWRMIIAGMKDDNQKIV